MYKILDQCRDLVRQPDCRAAYLRNIDGLTRGISGYFSNYIPEEIIAAAGLHPLRIIGRYDTPSDGSGSLSTPVCSFARDVFAAAAAGKFSVVRNVIFPNSCDSLKVLQQIWQNDLMAPPIHMLLHPVQANVQAVRYFAEQIELLAARLQKDSGLSFTEAQLAQHIQRYNRTRQLLRQIYACSVDGSRVLKGSDRIALVTAGMIMDRGEYNQVLEAILTKSVSASPAEHDTGHRIMIMGPLVDNLTLLETIEQRGASIVADDVTNGFRYCDLDVDLDGNLYENLARRYLRSGPSPTMHADPGDDGRRFCRRVAEVHPDGIIYINQKFCEPHIHNYLAKQEMLRRTGIKVLLLEVEHGGTSVSERDLLRIESFLEMLGES
jgi:benzoyl-CoA reductase subunit C